MIPSAGVGTLWPSVFAWIVISTGATTLNSARSGKLTRPGSVCTVAATSTARNAAWVGLK